MVPANWIDMNYCEFFNIDDIALEMKSSQRGIQITFFFSGGFRYFSKYGRPAPSIGDKHDMIFTKYQFCLDSKWSTVNVSTSSFIKLQLSRLFVTRSVVLYTFIWLLSLLEQLVLCLKWKEILNLKLKYPYRFIYALYSLFGGMLIGDEGEVKSGTGLKASISLFHLT